MLKKITDLDEQNLDVEGNNNKQSTTLDKEKDIQRNNLNLPLPLRAVLSTSRRKKVFFYFLPMKRV